MKRPIDKIDQEPGNPGTSPPAEIGPEPGTGNPGIQRATNIGGALSPNPSTSARTLSVQALIGESSADW
eukprot:9471394-Pyramimonas_sp.AAC.1